jgi:hypothetical protein
LSIKQSLAVYLRLRIVTITLTSKLLDVLDVVVVGGGGGSTTPTVGMLPAKIELESAHISATVIASFFIWISSFEVEKDAEIST